MVPGFFFAWISEESMRSGDINARQFAEPAADLLKFQGRDLLPFFESLQSFLDLIPPICSLSSLCIRMNLKEWFFTSFSLSLWITLTSWSYSWNPQHKAHCSSLVTALTSMEAGIISCMIFLKIFMMIFSLLWLLEASPGPGSSSFHILLFFPFSTTFIVIL